MLAGSVCGGARLSPLFRLIFILEVFVKFCEETPETCVRSGVLNTCQESNDVINGSCHRGDRLEKL